MITEERVHLSVQIFMRSMDEMDQADQELRQAISHTWPFTKRDGKLELLVPSPTRKRSNNTTCIFRAQCSKKPIDSFSDGT